MNKRIVAWMVCLALTLPALAGCGAGANAADLMSGVVQSGKTPSVDLSSGAETLADFSLKLFQKNVDGEKNTLISPLSVLTALAMTANGAAGETLSQMEEVFGLSIADLNELLCAYSRALPSGEKVQVSLANSIWFREHEGFSANPDFLQANADWYGAGLFKLPFDQAAVTKINAWVSEHTGGMVKDILDQIPSDAVMYLVNALAFEAEWQTVYEENQVRDGVFTTQAGEKRTVEMMYSTEHRYLRDDRASGFIKYYADQKYAFAALLPDEGVGVQEYVSTLTGERLRKLLQNARSEPVEASLPKFEIGYSVELSSLLQDMGMTDAFDPARADFSGLGTSPLGGFCISRVLHKSFISVGERGTKAGAATVVEMRETGALMDDPKSVHLDRPFVYALIDCETNLPLFLGTVMDIGS